MSIDWQNGALDRGRAALPGAFRPKSVRLAAAEPEVAPSPPPSPLPTAEDLASQEPSPPPLVDLRRLEAELGRRRLDEIADVVRMLTYGEMMELAESMWSVRPGDTALTEHNLPAVLYRWSTSRQTS